MTETAVRQPRPEDKTGHSFRFRNDTWADAEKAVKASAARDHTEWVTEAMEARLGYVRCDRARCGEAVPVEWGDLTGHPFDWWIGEAVAAVRGQRCRGGHRPVTIGNAAPQAPAPRSAPGSAVFLEPGGKPRVAAAVPEVPASRNRKGRRP